MSLYEPFLAVTDLPSALEPDAYEYVPLCPSELALTSSSENTNILFVYSSVANCP